MISLSEDNHMEDSFAVCFVTNRSLHALHVLYAGTRMLA